MMQIHRNQIIVISLFIYVGLVSTWPPAYSFSMQTFEEFEIGDDNQTDSDPDLIEDEVPEDDQEVRSNDEKYFNIHKWANKTKIHEDKRDIAKGIQRMKPQTPRKIHEYYLDPIEPIPWEAGFVDEKGNFVHPDNEKVYYLNEMAKSLIKRKIEEKTGTRRPRSQTESYKNLEKEYEEEVKKEELSKDTLNFTEPKEEESVKDAVGDIFHVKEKNCTEEEKSGIGLRAMECFMSDMAKSNKDRPKLFHRLLRIVSIWLFIYLVIAIPCYCQKGWCCCCFSPCFKFCRPHERIEEAKSYLANNPVGIYHKEDGRKVQYEPTNYERYTQKKLDKAIMNL